MWEYRYADELYHFGVKGMKWGVIRYQNKDGSYTEAGKRRNFKKIEKSYRKGMKNNFKDHNSGKAYQDLVRKNPDMVKALEPLVKAEQKRSRAIWQDGELVSNEYVKSINKYVKKHGRYPEPEVDHELFKKALGKVGTPNYDAQVKSYRDTGRKVVDNVLGEYGGKRLKTFNKTLGEDVIRRYVTIEAQRLNREEDARKLN